MRFWRSRNCMENWRQNGVKKRLKIKSFGFKSMKIDTKTMLEKVMRKWWKTVPTWSPKSRQMCKKCMPKTMPKLSIKMDTRDDPRWGSTPPFNSVYQVSGIMYLLSGIRYVVSGIWYPFIRYLVSCICYQVSGIWYQISGSRYQETDGKDTPLARQSRQARWRICESRFYWQLKKCGFFEDRFALQHSKKGP